MRKKERRDGIEETVSERTGKEWSARGSGILLLKLGN